MKQPYYSFDQGGYHFIVMDRNFMRSPDGSLVDYNTSNWGPSIVFMHQPVFLSEFFQEIGNADEILAIFDEANYNAARNGLGSRVAAVFMGHDHDDRYGERNGVHYFILNSSTYVYTQGQAYFFQDPLYAFVKLDPRGEMTLEGRTSTYRTPTPENVVARFPTRISDHRLFI